jgi:hypothetical protein
MDATLILIDSDAELLRTWALVDQLFNSNDPADVADGLICCNAQCPGACFGGPLQIVQKLAGTVVAVEAVGKVDNDRFGRQGTCRPLLPILRDCRC